MPPAEKSLLYWYFSNNRCVFLQDADALTYKFDHLDAILSALASAFPDLRRITSYSRSCTLVRLGKKNLEKLKQTGLSRIHTGLESGNLEVLSRMQKGSTPDMQINGGACRSECRAGVVPVHHAGSGWTDVVYATCRGYGSSGERDSTERDTPSNPGDSSEYTPV